MEADNNNEVDDGLNLTQLPREILEKICDFVDDAKTSLVLRLTCSVLKNLIDTYAGISIKLVEDPSQAYTKKRLNFIGSTAIDSVELLDVTGKDVGNKGMRSYLKRNYFFDDIFGFPQFLRTIGFRGKTDVILVYNILTKCHNLENLYFSDGFQFEGDLVALLIKEEKKSEFKIKFKPRERITWLSILSNRDDIFRKIYLKKLEWIYFNHQEVKSVRNIDLLNIMLLLKCIRSKALNRMFLMLSQIKDFTEIEYFNFSTIIAAFIEDHVETLRDISFGMKPPENLPTFSPSDVETAISGYFNEHVQLEPDEIQGEGDVVNQKIKMILTLREKLQSIGNTSKLTHLTIQIPHNFHWDFWLLFIESLTRLITLHMVVSTKFRILKNCEFLRNSRKTLKRFRMRLDVLNNFDFSGIEQCEKLEEVYIFNKPVSDRFISSGPIEAHVLNAKLLPPTLKALSLGSVVVATEDLNKMLSNLKILDTLVIMNMASVSPENSTDCKCLKKILRMRYLQSCLIQGFRCKSRKTCNRILQMLDFQIKPQDRTLINFETKNLSPQLLVPVFLDVISDEVERRYIWQQRFFPDGLCSHHSLRFNDEDPHL